MSAKGEPLPRELLGPGKMGGGLALGLVVMLAVTGQAQKSGVADSLRREALATARRHAPVFYFAPSEAYFPTLPFLSGFDLTHNRFGQPGNLRDFDAPVELAPIQRLCRVLSSRHGCTAADRKARPSRAELECESFAATPLAISESVIRWDCVERRYLAALTASGALALLRARQDSQVVQRTRDSRALDSLMSLGNASQDTLKRTQEALVSAQTFLSALRPCHDSSLSRIITDIRERWLDSLVELGYLRDATTDDKVSRLDSLRTILEHKPATLNVDSLLAESKRFGEVQAGIGQARLTRQAAIEAGDSATAAFSRLIAYATAQNEAPAVAPRFAVVFYKADTLNADAVRTLWGQLRRDDQLWKRARLAQAYDSLRLRGLTAVQYFMFYYRDQGLEGHSGDFERLVVIHPSDSAHQTELQVIIGVGHSAITPNNILVLTRRADVVDAQRPHILVELGGHSNATDRRPYGSFRLGWDANWRTAEGAWGVRDIQALNGTGFLGRYQEGATLTRDSALSVRLTLADTDARGGGCSETTPQIGCYRLVALEDFRSLVASATRLDSARMTPGSGRTIARDSFRVALQPFRELRSEWFAEYSRYDTTVTPPSALTSPADSLELEAAASAIARWRDVPLLKCNDVLETLSESNCRVGDARKQAFWERKKEDEASPQEPNRLLKAYLFRPSACRLRDEGYSHLFSSVLSGTTASYWGRPWRSDSHRLGLGMYVPLMCNRLLEIPGTLELQYSHGIGGGSREQTLAVLYDRDYFSELSWFAALSRNWGVVPRSHLRLQFGVTLQPVALVTRTWGVNPGNLFLQMIRLRAGLSVGDVRASDQVAANGRTVDRVRIDLGLQLRLPQQMKNWAK